MSEKKTDKQEQLDKVVKSKLKDMGLDALFHTVDNRHESKSQSNRDFTTNIPAFSLKKGVQFFDPKNIKFHIRRMFSLKPDCIIGVQIDSGCLKVIVLVSHEQTIQISDSYYIKVPISIVSSKEKTNDFLKDSLIKIISSYKERNVHICSVMSRRNVIIKIIDLPTDKNDEIQKMIDFEAEHNIPIPLNECVVDYAVLSTNNGISQILLAAIQKNELADHLSLYDSVGINLSSINVSSLVLYRALLNSENCKQKIIQLNVGYQDTDINIVDKGVLKVSRCVEWGFGNLIETLSSRHNVSLEVAEKMAYESGIVLKKTLKNDVSDLVAEIVMQWSEKLISEIVETNHHYQFQSSLSGFEKIVITGEGANIVNLDEYLWDQLKVKVIIQKPTFECDSNFEKLNNELIVLSGLSGNLVANAPKDLDLLPDSQREIQLKNVKKEKAISGVYVLFFLLFILWVLPSALLGIRNMQLNALENKISQIKPKAMIVKEVQDRIRTIEDYRSITYSCIEILREVSFLVSEDIYIDQFTFDQGYFVKLFGSAGSHTSAVNLSSAMRESHLFSDAVLNYTKKTDRLENKVKFEIIGNLGH